MIKNLTFSWRCASIDVADVEKHLNWSSIYTSLGNIHFVCQLLLTCHHTCCQCHMQNNWQLSSSQLPLYIYINMVPSGWDLCSGMYDGYKTLIFWCTDSSTLGLDQAQLHSVTVVHIKGYFIEQAYMMYWFTTPETMLLVQIIRDIRNITLVWWFTSASLLRSASTILLYPFLLATYNAVWPSWHVRWKKGR